MPRSSGGPTTFFGATLDDSCMTSDAAGSSATTATIFLYFVLSTGKIAAVPQTVNDLSWLSPNSVPMESPNKIRLALCTNTKPTNEQTQSPQRRY
jgi:hypothetical protein